MPKKFDHCLLQELITLGTISEKKGNQAPPVKKGTSGDFRD
jgi:hypothetical protein